MIDYTIDYIKAHDFSTGHRKRLLQDRKCRLLLLSENFRPQGDQQLDRGRGRYGDLPVLRHRFRHREHSGYPITREFLEQMRQYWF